MLKMMEATQEFVFMWNIPIPVYYLRFKTEAFFKNV